MKNTFYSFLIKKHLYLLSAGQGSKQQNFYEISNKLSKRTLTVAWKIMNVFSQSKFKDRLDHHLLLFVFVCFLRTPLSSSTMNELFECPQTNEPTILEIVQDSFTMQLEHLKDWQ